MKIILVMGLPGAGKTTLANELAKLIKAKRLNADEIRKAANDWDFSEEGRTRQSKRMADAALKMKNEGNYVVADFICPTTEARKLFPADYVFGWIQLKKEDLKIPIKCSLSLKNMTFMSLLKMHKPGHLKYMKI